MPKPCSGRLRKPVIEFQDEWRTWGDMRQVAERLAALIDASGAPLPSVHRLRRAQSSFRNRCVARLDRAGTHDLHAVCLSSGRGPGTGRRAAQAALLVAAQEDFSDELVGVLRAQGIAAIALSEMDACALPGLEQSRAEAAFAIRPALASSS